MTDKESLVKSQLKLIETVALYEGSTLSNELDRLIPDKPINSGVDVYNGYIIEQYSCPKCDRPIGDETMIFNYCPNCGKKIEK